MLQNNFHSQKNMYLHQSKTLNDILIKQLNKKCAKLTYLFDNCACKQQEIGIMLINLRDIQAILK